MAEANSQAIEGENTAKITIANSDALRREREAEALRRATAAEKVQTAKALQEAYAAEEAAEKQRASREQASKEADIIVKAEIDKRKVQIDAEAEAERYRRIAKGEADAIFAKMEAQARGVNEVLVKQADGFREIIGAANGDSGRGGAHDDRRQDAGDRQGAGRSHQEISRSTRSPFWDSGNGKGESSTANFLSGLMKSIPPMNELFNMAGMQLPEYLGKEKDAAKAEETPAESEEK